MIPGHSFRSRADPDSASHSGTGFRDVVSAEGPKRKAHPILSAKSGTQFPHAAPLGKFIPFRGLNPGRSFHSKQKAPTHDGAGAKGAAYAVDVEREQPVNNGCPHPALPAVADAAVGRIHHGQIWTQLAVKRAVGVLYGGRRGDRCDLADALAAICHRQ